MLCINYKMGNNEDGKLMDVLNIELDNLKLGKKDKEDFTIYCINSANKKPMDDSNKLYL